MSSARSPAYTPQEYLALDRVADEKSEYWDGALYAMTGASRAHNLIAVNLATALNTQLRARPCEVYAADMRVRIPRTYRYLYPDVVVVCDEPQFEDDQHDILINPTLLVEVLSPSTEAYDRGKKFDSYRRIPGLVTYLLVAQDERRIHLYIRQPDNQWLFAAFTEAEDVIDLPAIGCALPLADVYSKVSLPPSAD
ncbi:MAG: Uma2 family endonuclease [Anaerolineae bacterium]|nr:Uma2 family endonuclease [Anaerolineae bacterium]